MIVHAGLIALRHDGDWRGALIEGPSGCGKSDLALRALDHGFRLAADDRVRLFLSQGGLYGRAPGPIADLIEVRGVGIVRVESVSFAPVDLVVRCVAEGGAVERMPQPAVKTLLGVEIPVLDLWPFELAAPAKLRRALEGLGRRAQQAYQATLAPQGRRMGA